MKKIPMKKIPLPQSYQKLIHHLIRGKHIKDALESPVCHWAWLRLLLSRVTIVITLLDIHYTYYTCKFEDPDTI